MTASGFAMSEKRARVYTDDFYVIRAGTPLAATEYRDPVTGRTTQMPGDTPEVREILRGGRDG